jgi:hypothetical protein
LKFEDKKLVGDGAVWNTEKNLIPILLFNEPNFALSPTQSFSVCPVFRIRSHFKTVSGFELMELEVKR